jgi:hypothetical protein
MKLRCPVCHSSNSLEAFVSDDAGRELLVTLAGTGPLFAPLVHYLGCFRSPSRDLSYKRALKLTKEVLDLGADPAQLGAALHETTEALYAKRQNGDDRPLKNHNYLLQVLESVSNRDNIGSSMSMQPSNKGKGRSISKRAQGMAALEDWGNE